MSRDVEAKSIGEDGGKFLIRAKVSCYKYIFSHFFCNESV